MNCRLSIIIVSYNTREILRRCLEGINPLIDHRDFQVIVIDNDSNDGSPEMVRLFSPRILLTVNQVNRGFARACNQGFAQAKGEFMLLLNSDAFITEDAISQLLEFMTRNQEVGVCGPQLLFPDGTWQRSADRIISPRTALLDALGITSLELWANGLLWKYHRSYFRAGEVGYVDGACMLIRSAVIRQIGGLDERYHFFCEDVDFCRRASKAQWKIYLVPQSRVVHLRGGSYLDDPAILSVAAKRESLQTYITTYYGECGWNGYARLMVTNFRLRYLACSFFSLFRDFSGDKRRHYQKLISAFRQM